MNLRSKIKYSMAVLFFLILVGINILIRAQALSLVHSPLESRFPVSTTPADAGLEYEEIEVESVDGNILHGWYIPPTNGAVIMALHGYKWNRSGFIEEAEMLTRHGFGFLFVSIRAHDVNDGELIAFGLNEMPDIDAWFNFLLTREEVNPEAIAIFGESLGGSMAIQYAALNPQIKAVATHSAFSSMRDTIETSIRFFTGLPPFPFAPMIQFWAEWEIGGDIDDINASHWISEISPRPVFIMHGLKDTTVSPQSGNILFDAAEEPKELWTEAELGHGGFEREFPEEFEARLVAYFERYLLNE